MSSKGNTVLQRKIDEFQELRRAKRPAELEVRITLTKSQLELLVKSLDRDKSPVKASLEVQMMNVIEKSPGVTTTSRRK